MQKRISLLLLIVAVGLFLTACDSNSIKIGVIREEKVYTDSNVAKEAVKYLDEFSARLQPELATMQAELEKKPNNKSLQEDMNKRFYDMQQQFGAEQQKIVNKVNQLYAETRSKYIKKAGLSIILSSEMALGFDQTIDITDAIIAEMNKTTIDFATLTPDTASTNGTALKTNSTALKTNSTVNTPASSNSTKK